MTSPLNPLLSTSGPLVSRHDVLLVDLDGVVYVGANPVRHAVEVLGQARSGGSRVGYVTNNARRTPEEVAAHLREFGLEVVDDDVVTSAQAGARLVASLVPVGSAVLAIGGPGVSAALIERGLRPVMTDSEAPQAVMQGYGPDVSWHDLAEGTYAVARGVPFIATNLDLSVPTPRGIAPGNGALVAVIVAVTGVTPLVAGKPESPLMLESIERLAAASPLVIGDRLDTDIEAGSRLGLPSLLVLTGVTGVADLVAAPAHQRPTYVSEDLRGLLEEQPLVEVLPGGAVQCRQARVRVGERGLDVEQGGTDPIDLLRAVAVACWTRADRGEEIDAHRVATDFAAVHAPLAR
ncbi:MAG: HAD-IIA family hydrolase [Actinobacteria bacterium]|uniref:Unannotated protein n=1 Tax=freshwater metagenome TaxID=449393 RepID=A0A6J7QD81_9ZZZZ|nr:HAD-IIA family hydrolase [Actinomycetota bacterium]MSW40770.1 HAD-IIA family hydrolase [Actinomycetota bacterium]